MVCGRYTCSDVHSVSRIVLGDIHRRICHQYYYTSPQRGMGNQRMGYTDHSHTRKIQAGIYTCSQSHSNSDTIHYFDKASWRKGRSVCSSVQKIHSNSCSNTRSRIYFYSYHHLSTVPESKGHNAHRSHRKIPSDNHI